MAEVTKDTPEKDQAPHYSEGVKTDAELTLELDALTAENTRMELQYAAYQPSRALADQIAVAKLHNEELKAQLADCVARYGPAV